MYGNVLTKKQLSPSQQRGAGDALKIAILGISPNAKAALTEIENHRLVTIPDTAEELVEFSGPDPDVIIAGSNSTIKPKELAQLLRLKFSQSEILFLSETRKGYDRNDLIRNGFTDCFLYPFDVETLSARIIEHSAGESRFKSVNIIDLTPGEVLPFDVYIFLHMNGKYVLFSPQGIELTQEKFDRLERHKYRFVYVPKDQIKEFYSYTAKKLHAIAKGHGLSATERAERLETAVKDILGTVFCEREDNEESHKQGQSILDSCKGIVQAYILESTGSDWYSKLVSSLSGTLSAYTRHSDVATYAGLFAIGLGMQNPEEVALAALLRDTGLCMISPELAKKAEIGLLGPQERDLYYTHPEKTIAILKRKKIVLNKRIQRAILDHHECFDGSGFPRGKAGALVTTEAQIVSIAEKFYNLTIPREGIEPLSPREAAKLLSGYCDRKYGSQYDVNLLERILSLFPSSD